MPLLIPTRTDVPDYTLQVDLEGTTFGLALRWNTRAEGWFLSVFDVDGKLLLGGRRVVLDMPLLARFRTLGLPLGDFTAVDTTTQKAEPGLDELGTRVLLLYFPSTELPAEFTA